MNNTLPRQIAVEVNKVIIGKNDVVEMLLTAMLAGGHVLVEDVPGVGKTTLANAFGRAAGLTFKRAQFTPDVTASDITGFNMYNRSSSEFEYRPGMVVCNLLLADEINRTPPKTQSALLEAMEEKTITVDGVTYKLPSPFMVIATQNETGYVGTYPLPEAQLDRFLIKITIGYPDSEQEVAILKDRCASGASNKPYEMIKPLCKAADIAALIEETGKVRVESAIAEYIVRVTAATRVHPALSLGASPRSSLAMMRASQGRAYLAGRAYVTPEDVMEMFAPVLCHRLMLTQETKLRGITAHDILSEVVRGVRVPYRR
ncbi:hypothetical protein FACS1894133_3900 [Clostridia bacterium]|nr:hypothetical protein FACS1894133_3900 [Clostridia bacterium]